MAGPRLDPAAIEDLMWSEDDDFESAVSGLNMRGLLDLVTALQNAMAGEQHRFDELSVLLQRLPDSESHEHKKISAALCTSQMRLARLCTRNMRCFTQQAVRAKKDQWMITRSNSQEDSAPLEPPVVTVHSMAAPRVKGGDEEGLQISNGFRQSLRFFQNQVQRDSCPATSTVITTSVQPKSKIGASSELRIERGSSDPPSTRTSGSSAPTVDNILNNVKLIRASQNASISHPSDAQEKDKSIRTSSVPPTSSSSSPLTSSPSQRQDGSSAGRPTVIVTHPAGDRLRQVSAEDEDTDKKSDGESDYDSKDFVVHKNTFDERDLVEDAYSSLTEDYDTSEEQSRHVGPDIPSPDYGSSEEEEELDDEEDEEHEYQIHHSDSGDSQNLSGEERDEDFVDNSAAYIADPRRYVYYLDDKELEVIPEEDEDLYDEEEEDEFEDHIQDGLGMPSPSDGCEDDVIKTSQTECDSGVTDDQRSSTAEECDLEDGEEDYDRHSNSMGDTDSAKGSLLPDSCSESPTYMEKQGHRSSLDGELLSPEYTQSHERVNGEIPNGLGRYSLFGECIRPTQLMKQNSLNLTEDELKKLDLSNNELHDPLQYTSQPEQYFLKNNCSTPSELDDTSQSRNSTVTWDPTDLLQDLYKIEFSEEGSGNSSAGYINLEGYLEKLPTGRKKATYWNPWKRRYFRMQDGFLYCYENSQSEKQSLSLQLMGGNIDTLENNMIGIDDRKGHYIVVRCGKLEDADLWIKALQTQCSENFNLAYVKPIRYPLSSYKDVIIIDLGSCSIRAGILMDQATLPQVFFPTVCVADKETGKQVFGMEALHPEVRRNNTLSFPVLPSAKITKYTMDVETLPGLLKKVFQELNVNPRQYKIQVCVPRSFSLQTQIKVARTLLEDFGVRAINLTHQAILSLYAYNALSGIVVDIGERLDILPIIDGYIVESGVTRLPYGGQRIVHHLKHALAQKHISMVSDVESFLVRYSLENLCYVAEDYKEELRRFRNDPDSLEASISIKQFLQDDCPWDEVTLDCGRFQAPEGLFSPDLWGLDNPGLHKLVYRAIQECSMDIRKEMARSIYLSGGVTLLPGFIERLESELDKLTPARVIPKVHASPHRYHMAYLGACQLASSEGFEEVCVTLDEWRRHGNDCLQKWHI